MAGSFIFHYSAMKAGSFLSQDIHLSSFIHTRRNAMQCRFDFDISHHFLSRTALSLFESWFVNRLVNLLFINLLATSPSAAESRRWEPSTLSRWGLESWRWLESSSCSYVLAYRIFRVRTPRVSLTGSSGGSVRSTKARRRRKASYIRC